MSIFCLDMFESLSWQISTLVPSYLGSLSLNISYIGYFGTNIQLMRCEIIIQKPIDFILEIKWETWNTGNRSYYFYKHHEFLDTFRYYELSTLNVYYKLWSYGPTKWAQTQRLIENRTFFIARMHHLILSVVKNIFSNLKIKSFKL